MDTNPYSNIMKAVEAPGVESRPDNWQIINKWLTEGRDLLEIDRRMHEDKPDMDPELFRVMESAVKSDPTVKEARQHAADVKSAILTELCLKEPRYREALEAYRKAVSDAYVRRKDNAS